MLAAVAVGTATLPVPPAAGSARPSTEPLFAAPLRIDVPGHPRGLVGADFDGDGATDFAVGYVSGHAPELWLADSEGGFARSALPGGADPLAAGDVDGDGAADLLTTNGADGLDVRLGDGRGGFASPVRHTFAGSGIQEIHLAYLDGDADLDLAVHQRGSQDVGVYVSDGHGTFTLRDRYAVDATSITPVDLNADGAAEVVTLRRANIGGGPTTLARNDGTGRFAAPVRLDHRDWNEFAVGDTDAVGPPDLVVATDSGAIAYRGGDLSTGIPVRVSCEPRQGGFTDCRTSGLAVADLDGDGRADVVAGNFHDTISVVLAGDDGRFRDLTVLPYATSRYGPEFRLADVTGDCAPDLVVAGDRAVSVFLNTRQVDCRVEVPRPQGPPALPPLPALGAPQFTDPRRFGTDGGYVEPVTGDLNGDGAADLAYATGVPGGTRPERPAVVVRFGHPERGLGPARRIATGEDAPTGLGIGDVDGDGDLDLVAALGSTVAVIAGDGRGGLAAPRRVTTVPGEDLWLKALADLDGDGALDVLAYRTDVRNRIHRSAITVLLGDGRGGFAAHHTVLPFGPRSTRSPGPLAVADTDGDGDLDVTFVVPYAKDLAVLRNDGDGRLSAPKFVSAKVAGYDEWYAVGSIAAADLDGDGHADLVATRREARTIAVLRADGHGGFRKAVLLDSDGAQPSSLAIADVTGEGAPDLVVANARSDEVVVLTGDGRGSFAAPVRFGAGGMSPFALAVADVNGDGALDLVTYGTPLDHSARPGPLTVRLNTSPLARTTGGLLR